MSKRISLIVALLCVIIGVFIVSTFGMVPINLQELNRVASLSITDSKVTYDEDDDVYTMKMRFNKNNNTINIYDMLTFVAVNPAESCSDTSCKYIVDQSSDKVIVSSLGYLTIENEGLKLNQFIVTITTLDGSNISIKLLVIKPLDDQVDMGDDSGWVFG